MVILIVAAMICLAVITYRIARKQGRGSPIAWAIFSILLFPFSLAIFLIPTRRQPYNPETGIFKLKGFEMDTRSASFTINGFRYHGSAVREVQWQKHHNGVDGDAGGQITIVVDDIQHPVHYIRFRSIFADFDAHVERMKMLLCG